jgi:DNA-binding YbaB/EbfC family protein
MNELLRSAMEMQQRLIAAQDEARAVTVEGSAGAGLVRVTMTGEGDVTAVRIAPEAVDPNDLEMLEDLVVAALRDATHQVRERQAAAIGDLGGLGGLGDLGLPGLPGSSEPS